MKNLLCIYGKSQYDSTKLFMEEMMDAIAEQGVSVDYLDCYDEEQFAGQRQELEKKKYDAVFSINGMALEQSSSLSRLLLRQPTVYCTMLMDHPLIHHERMKNMYPYILVLSPDYHHVEYLEQYYPNIWCEGFLAHGGNRAERIVPYGERSIDVSFMGSYIDPAQVKKKILEYPPQMAALLLATAEKMIADTSLTLERALQMGLQTQGIQGKIEGFSEIMAEFREVDRYVRAFFRDKVVRTLVDSGIAVDVYGDGWQKMQVRNPEHLHIHGRIDFKESLEVVADSKISLNVMPWFKSGSHDRVYTSMLCGAVCVTDGSDYLVEQCQDGEEIALYHLEHLDALPSLVKELLADSAKAEMIARTGCRLAEERHTWRQRGLEVLEYLRTVEQIRSENA